VKINVDNLRSGYIFDPLINNNMATIPTFEQFKKTFTNGVGRPEKRFIEQYGNVSFEDAYPLYVTRITKMFSTSDKIDSFEKLLNTLGLQCVQSILSESRYYHYNGIKYRFSSHIYPTGSMTSDTCVDFAANPELIHTITF
jgi:UV DNA damage repair endonuclease